MKVTDEHEIVRRSEDRKQLPTLTDQVRDAILSAPVSRYRMAQETGVTEAQLSRFVTGKITLTLATIDRLMPHLHVELKPVRGGR